MLANAPSSRSKIQFINLQKKITHSVERLEDEFGDIMFSLVNVARHCGFNAALALERANSNFERRFRIVEQKVREQ
jgi:uncharacterized protein YabN with tetrapyrrole methylase and pyrophosphatase domain